MRTGAVDILVVLICTAPDSPSTSAPATRRLPAAAQTTPRHPTDIPCGKRRRTHGHTVGHAPAEGGRMVSGAKATARLGPAPSRAKTPAVSDRDLCILSLLSWHRVMTQTPARGGNAADPDPHPPVQMLSARP